MFWPIFHIVFKVIAAVVAVKIVYKSRNPHKAMAWMLVLLLLPLVGLVIYFFFGRTGHKERIIGERQASVSSSFLRKFVKNSTSRVDQAYSPMVRFLKMRCSAFPYANNNLRLFYMGTEMVDSLIDDIQKARHHIHIQFYIFADDSVGRRVSQALMEKARSGVRVRVVYDDVGCFRVPNRFFRQMRKEGIEVGCFLDVWFPRFTGRVNYRNHRKIVIIDGQTGYIGGMNIAERYVHGNHLGEWHDVHMRIEGNAVYGLQSSFIDDWYFISGKNITSPALFPDVRIDGKAQNVVQTVRSNPVGQRADIMNGLLMLITSARHYIYVQTPYFLPTEPMVAALRIAAMSGVDVRIMLPGRSDSILPYWGSRSFLDEMLSAGVRVYVFNGGFLHSKVWVSDDKVSSVGSTNVDFRSFENNFEINSFIYDSNTAIELCRHFKQQQSMCTKLSLSEWRRRSVVARTVESFVRLLSPLL